MNKKQYLWTIIVVLILVGIDQAIKISVLKYLDGSSVTLIRNILELSYVENTGVSFGIRDGK